jgi:hypothetical protein
VRELEQLKSRISSAVEDSTNALLALESLTMFSIPEAVFTYTRTPNTSSNSNTKEGEKEGGRGKESHKSDDERLRAVARAACSELLPVLMPLLRCRLVDASAYNTILGLSRSVEKELQPMVRDLADSLRITFTVTERPLKRKETLLQVFKEVVQVAGPLQRLLRGVQTHVSRAHMLAQAHAHAHAQTNAHTDAVKMVLLPSTVQLLYPVLRALLSLPSLVPGCELAFMVLDA